MNDQGLEKIPFDFRSYCWERATEAKENQWEIFKTAIMQMRFGGVSSEEEAKRLFWAEQINHKLFFDANISVQEMALNLSEDIQNSFQHASRPISTLREPEEQTIEILNYYFPTQKGLDNFQMALDGAFDSKTKVKSEESFVFEDQLPSVEDNKSSLVKTSSEISEKALLVDEPHKNLDEERPKVKIYLEFKQNKYDLSALGDLSDKIQKVIDEHFFGIQ